MKGAGVAALVGEMKSLGLTLREEIAPARVGPIVVSGVLADQLAKELGAGAEAGAVVVGDDRRVAGAEVLVRIIAGDPTPEDTELVRAATTQGVPVVIVELWPQEDWTPPFVLSPFVVECRAGQGFPIGTIADRIAEATEDSAALASAVPTISDAARAGAIRQAVIRAALIGVAASRFGASRPLISLEQVRMASRLRRVSSATEMGDDRKVLAAGAGAVLASGFVFRRIARSARGILPDPIAHAAVAAAGTWFLAKALEAVESHLPSDD
jgi:hypothetical protein